MIIIPEPRKDLYVPETCGDGFVFAQSIEYGVFKNRYWQEHVFGTYEQMERFARYALKAQCHYDILVTDAYAFKVE